ncbi:MAG: PspA/IM30 family protein [Candidatus Thiodiazotropha sp. (ex. Lucinoma kazani)]
MALITRVSRLFQSDLHAVLDRIEEPEALLRQAVREMQEALDRDAHQAKLLKREQAQLVVRQADLKRSLAEIEEN